MTTTTHTSMTHTGNAGTNETTQDRSRWSGAMQLAAAGALVAGPALFALGMATSPQAESLAKADYVASLSRDLALTQISALFLHYGNLLMGLGILAAPTLVRGRRGMALTSIGAIAAALGFTNLSGSLLSDWWNAAAGTIAPDQAPAIFEHVLDASMIQLWFGTEPLSLLGPLLVLIGLSRAGVLSWWTVPVLIGGIVGFIVLSNGTPVVAAAAILVGLSPIALIGVRVAQRRSIARR